MKKTLVSLLGISLALSSITVFADDRDDDVKMPKTPTVSSISSVSERNERWVTNSLSRVKARGARLIEERVRSLTSNASAITSSRDLTVEQKAALNTVITTNITGLTLLKTSIASSTEASSTKALIDSVYTNFRIYGIVIPEIRLEKRIYDLQNHVATLSDTFNKVQNKINEYKGKGKDVTVWQKNLDDAKILVATDAAKLTVLMTQARTLTPASYGTTSKMIIDSVNQGIKSVAKDFNTIEKTLKKPKTLNNATTTPVTASSSPLALTSWIWVSATKDGVATTSPAGDKFELSFNQNNQVSSKTDCNNLMGSFTSGTSSLSFGPLAMTMMFCEGSREAEYAGLLSKVSAYKVEGTTLTLTHDKGVMVFRKK